MNNLNAKREGCWEQKGVGCYCDLPPQSQISSIHSSTINLITVTCLKNQIGEERDRQSGIPVTHQGNFAINRSEWTKDMNKTIFDKPLYAYNCSN